jgi:hypothetical protein
VRCNIFALLMLCQVEQSIHVPRARSAPLTAALASCAQLWRQTPTACSTKAVRLVHYNGVVPPVQKDLVQYNMQHQRRNGGRLHSLRFNRQHNTRSMLRLHWFP